MPKHRAGEKVKIFLDSSVMIAATISFTGGSFRIFTEGHEGQLRLFTNEYAIAESKRAISRKFPHFSDNFQHLINTSYITIRPNLQEKFVERYLEIINSEDVYILAGAIGVKAYFLITLDKDFISQKIENAELPLIITTPKDFFNDYFDML